MTREFLKSRRQSKSNSSNSSEVSKSPLLMHAMMPKEVEYVQKKPRTAVRSNTEPAEDMEQAFMQSDSAPCNRRRSKAGTLPFLFRPDRTLSPPDESTMSHIRRLIYRTSHCYCCPPRWLRVQKIMKTIRVVKLHISVILRISQNSKYSQFLKFCGDFNEHFRINKIILHFQIKLFKL